MVPPPAVSMPRPPSGRRHDPPMWTMLVAMLVASAGVHLLLWPVGDQVLSLSWSSTPLPAAGGVMEVSLLELEPEPPSLPGQLVNLDRVLDERPPEDAKRISEFDSRVEQETAAPNRRPTPGAAPQRAGDAPDAQPNEPTPTPQDSRARPLPLGRDNPNDAVGHLIEPGQLPEDERGDRSNDAGATAPRPRFGRPGSPEAMRKTFGGPGSIDNLDGVKEGSENLLNTDRFKFSSFFNRMRNAIAQHWDPNEVMQKLDPDGRTYGRRTRRTMLHIQLTPKGAVQRIRTVDASGVRDLDAEAIQAVNLAAPFVNPPPQMVDKNTGFIEIDFLFILEDGKMRIRRYLR